MKKVLSIALAVIMIVGLSVTAWATKAETVEVEHQDTLTVYANHVYNVVLGASNDGKEVTEVIVPNIVHSVKTKDADKEGPATVEFSVGEVLTTDKKAERLIVTIKEGNKKKKVYLNLEVNPQYITLEENSWTFVENGVAYSLPKTGDTYFAFDFGEILVQNEGQKRVNLTYDNKITEELFDKYGDALVGVVDFKGEATFSRVAKINFNEKYDGKNIFAYEVVGDKLVALDKTEEGYGRNVVKLGSYVFLTEEWKELPAPAPMPEVEPSKPVEANDLNNINQNPGTGR